VTLTLAHLFPHFDTLIQTPADIQRLNAAILQLAVQGKLVPQDPQDEPAAVLLERIAAEKARLVAEKIIRKSKPVPLIELDEIPYELPAGWEWLRLVEAGIINPRNDVEEEQLVSFIPMTLINDGILGGHESDQRPWKEIRSGFTHFAEGDVGVAKITPCFQNLKSTVFRELINGVGAGTTELHIFRPLTGTILPDYVLAFFKTPAFIADGVAKMTGTAGQQRVPRDYIENVLFPLPPLAEQKRIVAKVDELFAQTRALEAKLRRAEEEIVIVNRTVLHRVQTAPDAATFDHAVHTLRDHFDQLTTDPRTLTDLRQTILQLAVQGKLVPQDPQDEPAAVLLERIGNESTLQSHSSMISDEEGPYVLPNSWEWVNFGTICNHRLGKMLDKQKNKGEYRPYLRNLNVQWDRIEFDDIQVMRFEPQEFDEYRLVPGDLLICEGGEPGRCAIWSDPDTEMMFQKAIHCAKPYGGINPRYLLFHLKADAGNGRLAEYFTGATIKHFTGKALASYLIALPPLAEQKRIVAKVDELLARCDALAAKLGAVQVASGQLTAAVLHGVVG